MDSDPSMIPFGSARQSAAPNPVRLSDHVVSSLAAAAQKAGISLQQDESKRWLDAVIQAVTAPGEWQQEHSAEIAGHELVLIDFDPAWAERLRAIGRRIASRPSADVQTGLAIAGSAALARAHPYPSDIDFFERIHIIAPTHDAACATLVRIIRATLDDTGSLPDFTFEELMLGVYEGQSVRWTPSDVAQGIRAIERPDGTCITIDLDTAARSPGFTKLDWIVCDDGPMSPCRISKVIDATWQAPDGSIMSLDGAIDGDFQQVYLDAPSASLARAVTRGLTPVAVADYVAQMEREVAYYARKNPPDFVKVAKRLYNICRFSHRFAEALYIRALFDEPAARLHQIRARLELAPSLTSDDVAALQQDLRVCVDLAEGWLAASDAERLRRCQQQWCTSGASEIATLCSEVEHLLATAASRAFAHSLHSYSPIQAMIADICQRNE